MTAGMFFGWWAEAQAPNYKLYFYGGSPHYNNIRVSNVLDHPVNINIGK